MFIAPYQSFAQSRGQERREEAKEKKEWAEDQKEKAEEKAEDKRNRAQNKIEKTQDKMDRDSREMPEQVIKENEGNAYGRNKGNMSGREFGQYRAEMARNKSEVTLIKLNETENYLINQRERLNNLRRSLEEERSIRNADQTVIEERRIRITRAEEKLSQLNQLLNQSKENLIRTERSLQAVFDN